MLLQASGNWTLQPSEIPSNQHFFDFNMILQKIFEGKIEGCFFSLYTFPQYEVKQKGKYNTHQTLK